MNSGRLLAVLTGINLLPFGYQLLLQPHLAVASTRDVPDVLRGHALEIVDARGKVRASISIFPENPKQIWNGKPYPETVLLRLSTADGRPNVKLGASKTGSTLVIGGEADPTYIQLSADERQSAITLINKDSTRRVINP